MIVQCPHCQSKSRVDDAGAARGARVRCAACAHVFLPNTAIVPPKAAVASEAGGAQGEFGGKTSLFTGVVSRELIGRTAAGSTASPTPLPQAMDMLPTQADAAPREAAGPSRAAAAADAGFGADRTQAIDVRQLAAFSARLPAAQEAAADLHSGLEKAPLRPAPVAAAAPSARSDVPQPDESTTAVVGTHEVGLLSAGVTTASRLLGGISAALGACGLVFFSAGNAIWTQAGCLGGSAIQMDLAPGAGLKVEQVTSTLYDLADGHQALVALGSASGPKGAASTERYEAQLTLTNSAGQVVGQARGPLGAVLSLEELATISLPDSAAAELRRRVAQLPAAAPNGGARKFMAVIKDPKQPVCAMVQSLTLVPALSAEAAADVQPAAVNAAADIPSEVIVDPELPQTAIPPPPQAVSAMPPVDAIAPAAPQSAAAEAASLRTTKNRHRAASTGRRVTKPQAPNPRRGAP